MKDVPENELLSAYLDGELTAAEQAEVEQLLVANPAARQLLEELRTLSTTLQGMPQYTLREDLSERVLRRAERQILTGSQPLSSPTSVSRDRPARSVFRRLLSPRAIAWSGIAVAVALMLMMDGDGFRQGPPVDEIARGPEPAEADVPAPAIQAVPETAGEEDDTPRAEQGEGGRAVTFGKGIGRQPAPHREIAPHGEVVNGSIGNRSDVPAIAKSEMGLAVQAGAVPGGQTERSPVEAKDYQAIPEKPGPDTFAAQRSALGRQGAAGREGTGGRGGMGGMGTSPSGPASRPPKSMGTVDSLQAGTLAGVALNDVRAYLDQRMGPAANEVLLVQCDISPIALQQEAFVRLLGSNGITLEEAVFDVDSDEAAGIAGANLSDGVRRGHVPSLRDRERGREEERGYAYGQGEAVAEDAAKLAAPGRQTAVQQRASEEQIQTTLGELAHASNQELVWVEATPEQVWATLDGLSEQASDFLSVKVDPAPAVEAQRSLSRYNRVNLPLDNLRRGGRFQLGQGAQSLKPTVRAKPDVVGDAKSQEKVVATDRNGEPSVVEGLETAQSRDQALQMPQQRRVSELRSRALRYFATDSRGAKTLEAQQLARDVAPEARPPEVRDSELDQPEAEALAETKAPALPSAAPSAAPPADQPVNGPYPGSRPADSAPTAGEKLRSFFDSLAQSMGSSRVDQPARPKSPAGGPVLAPAAEPEPSSAKGASAPTTGVPTEEFAGGEPEAATPGGAPSPPPAEKPIARGDETHQSQSPSQQVVAGAQVGQSTRFGNGQRGPAKLADTPAQTLEEADPASRPAASKAGTGQQLSGPVFGVTPSLKEQSRSPSGSQTEFEAGKQKAVRSEQGDYRHALPGSSQPVYRVLFVFRVVGPNLADMHAADMVPAAAAPAAEMAPAQAVEPPPAAPPAVHE
ncbi:MAG: zf-HC2 domain-containing protein [Pirellulales bacterium]|nr:zf-HC2 domain-containing protein [Pirellulales bacterium]